MSLPKHLTVRAFEEALHDKLSRLSKGELKQILFRMGSRIGPTERQGFLDGLDPPTEAESQPLGAPESGLIPAIADLREAIQKRMKDSEPPEDHGWYGDEEEDDDPYEELVEEWGELLRCARDAFEQGDHPLALLAYQRLFECLLLDDEYGRRLSLDSLVGVDGVVLEEDEARYLRSVYETAERSVRPTRLFEAMADVRKWFFRSRPRLTVIDEICGRELSDRDRFLEDWQSFLSEKDGADADLLLREVTRLREGTEGLERLALARGKARPGAYLDWLDALEKEGKDLEVLQGAARALQTIPAESAGPQRALVADRYCAAAMRTGNLDGIPSARWESFISDASLERLLDIAEAVESDLKAWMRRCGDFIESRRKPTRRQGGLSEWDESDGVVLLAHARLLSGQWKEAVDLVRAMRILGWSSSSRAQALVLAALLCLLSSEETGAIPPAALEHLREHARGTIFSGARVLLAEHDDEPAGKPTAGMGREDRLEKVYGLAFRATPIAAEEQEGLLAWCLDVTRKRVKAIVTNQHRGAYDRAARLIAACAETIRVRGDRRKADQFVEQFRKQFSRHSAFRRAVAKVWNPDPS